MRLLTDFVFGLALFVALPSCAIEMPVNAGAPAAMQHTGHTGHGDHSGMASMGKPAVWSGFPMLKTRMGGESRERMGITVVPQNIVAGSIDAYSSDIKDAGMHRQLQLGMGGARLDKPEVGGFHWLSAREELADKVLVASTVYYFSHPGKNPTAMFMQQKHELELVPQPFPREHSRYRANEDWRFLVRFNSQPLPNQKVSMETRNGSKAELVSDAQGVITLHLPDDFNVAEDEKPGGGMQSHGRRSADFVLATEYVANDKTYLTAFNSSYGPDAFDQRSLAMGLGFTLLGMLSAVPLLRQRKAETRQATDATETTGNGEA